MSEGGNAPAPGRPLLVLALCCLITMLEGFDLQAAGVAAPKLARAFGLDAATLGWLFSGGTIGMILGAAIGGRVADRVGRKPVLLAAVTLFAAMSVACALASGVATLLIARFLTGLGLGAALPSLIAIVAETSPPGRRNLAIGLLHAGLPIGGGLASLFSLVVDGVDWRAVFLAGGLAPLAVLPLAAVVLPGTTDPGSSKPAGPSSARGALFGEGRSASTVLLWAAFLCAILTPVLLIYWLPTLLVSRGLTQPQAFAVQTLFGLFGAAGSLTVGALMDRLPRAAVVGAAFVLSMAALWLLALAPAQFGLSLVLGALVGAVVSGAQASVYALAPAVYPRLVRGTGVGAAVGAGRVGSAVGPLLAAALIGAGSSAGEVLFGLVPIAITGGLAAFVLAWRTDRARLRADPPALPRPLSPASPGGPAGDRPRPD